MKSVRVALLYAASVAASVVVFLLIERVGLTLTATGDVASTSGQTTGSAPGSGVSGAVASGGSTVMHVLLAIAVIVIATNLVGAIFRRLRQPQVMGEVVAGILLGPSFLGWLAPAAASRLISSDVVPYLSVISQIGVVLYMFLVGVELDTELLRKRTQASILISHTSIVAPFLLGSALALWIYPSYASHGVAFTPFALFLGVAMSITAFPVLARILTDRGMQKSPTGVLALACAAAGDVTAWCLLAFVVAVTRAQPGKTIYVLILTVAYILFVLFVAKPGVLWLARKRDREGRTSRGMFAAVCSALLLAAFATEWIGIHALFGAFLLGAMLPHDSALARDLRAKCEDLVSVLLLPLFFAFTGLRTQIGLLNSGREWIVCGVIILVASLGKFGGSYAAARVAGVEWREAASLGVLMNTRGLMELIVLNVGLDLGVLSPSLFAMFVVMALVTTLATAPVLEGLERKTETEAA
jgi:Kef-type K+ transport system membrane component KefB